MATAIIVIVLLVLVCFSIKSSLLHFAGKGGCCGGGDAPKKNRKHLKGKIVKTETYSVTGIHCNNCKIRIENSVNKLQGLTGKVSLYEQTVTVTGIREFQRDEVVRAIHSAGYEVTD